MSTLLHAFRDLQYEVQIHILTIETYHIGRRAGTRHEIRTHIWPREYDAFRKLWPTADTIVLARELDAKPDELWSICQIYSRRECLAKYLPYSRPLGRSPSPLAIEAKLDAPDFGMFRKEA
jgi:hypothetical protein